MGLRVEGLGVEGLAIALGVWVEDLWAWGASGVRFRTYSMPL